MTENKKIEMFTDTEALDQLGKGGFAIANQDNKYRQPDGTYDDIPWAMSEAAWRGYVLPPGCRFVRVKVDLRIQIEG